MLQQSGDLELVGRDRSLNANKIVGQPFLKILQKVPQIHITFSSYRHHSDIVHSPAQAGIQGMGGDSLIPAFAGMTAGCVDSSVNELHALRLIVQIGNGRYGALECCAFRSMTPLLHHSSTPLFLILPPVPTLSACTP